MTRFSCCLWQNERADDRHWGPPPTKCTVPLPVLESQPRRVVHSVFSPFVVHFRVLASKTWEVVVTLRQKLLRQQFSGEYDNRSWKLLPCISNIDTHHRPSAKLRADGRKGEQPHIVLANLIDRSILSFGWQHELFFSDIILIIVFFFLFITLFLLSKCNTVSVLFFFFFWFICLFVRVAFSSRFPLFPG